MVRVLITGSAGFIGFHLAQALLRTGAVVHGYDSMNAYYDVALKRDRTALLARHDGFSMTEGALEDQALLDSVSDSFAPFAKRIAEAAKSDDIRLLGTSGTVTTLASLHLELPHYDRKAVDGLIVPSLAMRDISTRLSGMSPAERSELPCIGQDRADLVVAGCAILESILDLWPAERLGVADRGIREGILRSLMAAERQSERSLKALHEMRSQQEAK